MVYCGKASQACQLCRRRRIKCDKVRPECSQCVRAGKKCPGYRDQLSLMFRDENTKVIQKAHAQWASSGPLESPATSSVSPGLVTSPISFVTSDGSPIDVTPIPRRPSSVQRAVMTTPRLPTAVQPTAFEKGVHFYIHHYILGFPQEVKSPSELRDAHWMASPTVADMMAAVGLTGLSNLTSDGDMALAAQQKYGQALRNTANFLRNPSALDARAALTSVVLLALFEVVQGKSTTASTVRAHMMGAGALLSSLMPNVVIPMGTFRAIVQLCFSVLVSCHSADITLPETALHWVEISNQFLKPEEKASTELLLIIARFTRLSATVKKLSLTHSPGTKRKLLLQAAAIEMELAEWEQRQNQPDTLWEFTTEEAVLPTEAAFRNRFHVYRGGMWVARIWNCYRWARILANQTVIELLDDYANDPSIGSVSLDQRLETTRRLADELLVSWPTHFRHPRLTQAHRDLLDRSSQFRPGAGNGVFSAGVAVILAQLKGTILAPGVPDEFGKWVLGVIETVWAETGMLRARTTADHLRSYLEKRVTVKVEVAEVEEETTP